VLDGVLGLVPEALLDHVRAHDGEHPARDPRRHTGDRAGEPRGQRPPGERHEGLEEAEEDSDARGLAPRRAAHPGALRERHGERVRRERDGDHHELENSHEKAA
jgi:hypothetical protein